MEAWCDDSELSRGYDRPDRVLEPGGGEVIPRRKLDVPMYVAMLYRGFYDIAPGLGYRAIRSGDNRVSLKCAIDASASYCREIRAGSVGYCGIAKRGFSVDSGIRNCSWQTADCFKRSRDGSAKVLNFLWKRERMSGTVGETPFACDYAIVALSSTHALIVRLAV